MEGEEGKEGSEILFCLHGCEGLSKSSSSGGGSCCPGKGAAGTENKDLHEPTALKTPATGATLEEAALLRPGVWAGAESSFACTGVSK